MTVATNSRPLFSIVIPCYNRAHTIGRAINSCLCQSIGNFEIVVVDNGSTDDLPGALRRCEDSRIRYVWHAQRGAAAARNAGVNAAAGAYVAFLDSDDVFLPTKLSTVYEHIVRKPDAVIYSQMYVDRGVGPMWIKPPRGLAAGEDIAAYLFSQQTWLPVSTIVLPVAFAKKIKWNENLSVCEDLSFALDLARGGAELHMISDPLAICSDVTDKSRLTLDPIYNAKVSKVGHELILWIERERTSLSEKAYLAFYARFVSRYSAGTDPLGAAAHLWRAWRRGALPVRAIASQALLTYTPRVYRRLCDVAVRIAGVPPPELVAEPASSQAKADGTRTG